jgi:hypothetical protein
LQEVQRQAALKMLQAQNQDQLAGGNPIANTFGEIGLSTHSVVYGYVPAWKSYLLKEQ